MKICDEVDKSKFKFFIILGINCRMNKRLLEVELILKHLKIPFKKVKY